MNFLVLGPVRVCNGAGELDVGGPKVRAILVALLMQAGYVVRTERLIDVVWGEAPPTSARNLVHVYVCRLRRVLRAASADRMLVSSHAGYRLDIDPEQLDLARFERLSAAGRQALRAERAAEAERLFSQALSLWRGPAFAGLTAEPLRRKAARLEAARLAAVEDRIDAYLALGLHADIVLELADLVEAHPLRERLAGQLMIALYRCDRRVEALEVFSTARSHLAAQLGLEPSAQLHRLQRAVLSANPVLTPSS